VVVTVQLELPHPELDGGSEKILVVVVVDTLVMLVVNVLQPVMVEVMVTVSAMLTFWVNVRVDVCVVVMWSVAYIVCISVVRNVTVARWISVSVVEDFAHVSDGAQEAELVVELAHGSERHGLELVVVCRFMVLTLCAARLLSKKLELIVDTEEPTIVGGSTAAEIA
jgi:hypothetical protein